MCLSVDSRFGSLLAYLFVCLSVVCLFIRLFCYDVCIQTFHACSFSFDMLSIIMTRTHQINREPLTARIALAHILRCPCLLGGGVFTLRLLDFPAMLHEAAIVRETWRAELKVGRRENFQGGYARPPGRSVKHLFMSFVLAGAAPTGRECARAF